MNIIDDLSNLKFSGEGETTFVEHTKCFLRFFIEHNISLEDISSRLFIIMFEGHVT